MDHGERERETGAAYFEQVKSTLPASSISFSLPGKSQPLSRFGSMYPSVRSLIGVSLVSRGPGAEAPIM